MVVQTSSRRWGRRTGGRVLLRLSILLGFLCLDALPGVSNAAEPNASSRKTMETTEPTETQETQKTEESEPESQSTPGEPMRGEARRFYEQGLARYAAHEFASAVRSFEAGHAIDGRREFLFAEGQAFRLAGDCARAISLYEQFLATRPPAIQIEATQLGLARCQSRSPPGAGAPLAVTAPPTVPLPTSARAARARGAASSTATDAPSAPLVRPQSVSISRRLLRDPWTTGALASGLLALGTGVSFWVAAENAHARAESIRNSYDEFANASQLFEHRRTLSVVALSAGTVLAVCGMGRAWWVAGHDEAVPRASGIAFDGRRLLWRAIF